MVTIHPVLFYTLWGYLNNITKYPNCQALFVLRIEHRVKKAEASIQEPESRKSSGV